MIPQKRHLPLRLLWQARERRKAAGERLALNADIPARFRSCLRPHLPPYGSEQRAIFRLSSWLAKHRLSRRGPRLPSSCKMSTHLSRGDLQNLGGKLGVCMLLTKLCASGRHTVQTSKGKSLLSPGLSHQMSRALIQRHSAMLLQLS